MILELLLASAMSAPASAAAPAPSPVLARAPQAVPAKAIADLWDQLGAAINAEDAPAALALSKLIADHPDFEREPLARRQAVGNLLGLLYAGEGQYAAALPYLIESSEREGASVNLWFNRIGAHAGVDDMTGAARAMITLLDRHPDVIEDLSTDYVFQLEANPDVAPPPGGVRSPLRASGRWLAGSPRFQRLDPAR